MAHPNFVEKTFAGGSKTAKIVKVFSLESFPLYGINYDIIQYSSSWCIITTMQPPIVVTLCLWTFVRFLWHYVVHLLSDIYLAGIYWVHVLMCAQGICNNTQSGVMHKPRYTTDSVIASSKYTTLKHTVPSKCVLIYFCLKWPSTKLMCWNEHVSMVILYHVKVGSL